MAVCKWWERKRKRPMSLPLSQYSQYNLKHSTKLGLVPTWVSFLQDPKPCCGPLADTHTHILVTVQWARPFQSWIAKQDRLHTPDNLQSYSLCEKINKINQQHIYPTSYVALWFGTTILPLMVMMLEILELYAHTQWD